MTVRKEINQRKAGALLSYLNLGLGCIVPLLYTPIMLKILGQAEYGLYSLSQSVIGYLSLLNFGMGSAIVRYAAKFRAEEKTDEVRGLMGLFVAIYSVLAVLVCAIGGILVSKADVFFASSLSAAEVVRLRTLMVIMIGSTAVSLPLSVLASIISAYERFVFSRLTAIFGTVITPICNLIVLYAGHASVGIALAGFAIQVLTGAVNSIYCVRKLGLYPRFRQMPMNLLKEIWVFSAFVFLSSIVDMLYWATDKVLIGALVGSAAVAVYNVGGVFTSMMQNMSQAISNMFTPRVMMMARQDAEAAQTSELMIRIGRLQYYIVSFVLSGYIVFGQIFIRFWAGQGYQDAYFVALLTMVPLAVPLIQSIAYSTIVAQNKHRFRAVIYSIIAVINAVSTWLVIPRFGIIGAACCTAVAFILGNGIIMNIYYSRVIGLDIQGFWKNIGRISYVPAAMATGGYLLINPVLGIDSIPAFLAGVCVFSALFWVLSWFISMNGYEKDLFGSVSIRLLRRIRKK